ncbi:MAG: acylphosphatase [bacterium]|nr:acylphosphatase [bacterium]MDZ4285774.1 acylphosphatase [Candidatus Sungbacteria bacterium]
MSIACAEIIIYGSVQGVLFRHTAKQMAEQMEITGWARNEPDGSVKILAQGQKDTLQKLIDWCKKGTEWSRVDDVKIEWKDATEPFTAFEIL